MHRVEIAMHARAEITTVSDDREHFYSRNLHANYISLHIFQCKGMQDILKGLGTPSYLSVRSSLDCLLLSKMQEMMDTHVPTAEAE